MKYLVALFVCLVGSTALANVRNTGTTRQDSVAIYVVCLDSTGKPSTCDSFYVRVVNNSANAVLFSDSGTLAMTGMDSISGKSEYYYHRLVADIDGGGTEGEYVLFVNAKKTAGSGWTTPNSRVFEIDNYSNPDSIITKQVKVQSTTDTAVSIVTSASAKPTVAIRQTGATGYGQYVSSANSDAVVFDAKGTGTVYGFRAQNAASTTGGGAIFDGSGGGGSGAVYSGGSGSMSLGGISNTSDFGASPTFQGANIYAFTNLVGTIQVRVDSTSNASWFKTTGLSAVYADSTFNGRLLYVKYSTRTNPRIAGEVTRVVKYDSIGTSKADVFYMYPPLSQAPAVGDTFILYPLYSTSPTMVKDTIGSVSVNFANDTGWVTAKAWIKASLDTLQVYDNAGRFQLVTQQILDTLQTYDNASRFQANVQELLDTIKTYDNSGRFQLLVQEILDTLKTYDNAGRFQANTQESLDSLKNQDNWVSKEATTQKAIDTGTAIHAKLNIVGDTANADIAVDRADSALTAKVRDSVHAVHVAIEDLRDSTHVVHMAVDTAISIALESLDSLQSISTWLTAKIDTILLSQGLRIGARATNEYGTDWDIIHLFIGNDPLIDLYRYHIGRAARSYPDSTKVVAP